MGEPIPAPANPISIDLSSEITTTTTTTNAAPSPPPPSCSELTLIEPSHKKKHHKPKVVRLFHSVLRSFPIINPACKFPALPVGLPDTHRGSSGTRVSGTLFGYRKGKVSLSIQENTQCLPTVVVELPIQMNVLQKELTSGMVRIALECERRLPAKDQRIGLLEEPVWTMYCNGKKAGYGIKRDATAEDLNVMETLKAVSMGVGVLPGKSETEELDGELAYIRAHFDHVVGSRDSETLYMLGPEGNTGPELTIFFVRI